MQPIGDDTLTRKGLPETAQVTAGHTYLVPNRRMTPRLIVLAGLVALFFIANAWYHTLLFGLVMASWLGTYPRVSLNHQMVQREFLVMFVSAHVRRWSWRKFVCIETGLEPRFGVGLGCLMAAMVGIWNVILAKTLDWLVPWFGGDYKIWVQDLSERRVLVWQGNGESYFRRNLDVLQEASGLPVERR